MPFSTLGLSDHILRGVTASAYTTPTEIQSLAIPRILAGKDVIGCAQTGTGKTAAFVLPLLHRMTEKTDNPRTKGIRALILAPTRELALQVDEAIVTYGKFTDIRTTAVFGGVNMDNQIKRLQRGVDIVVATPGRLLDHLARRTIDLSHVQYLILDEADRMFDMGFINDVKKIIARVPAKRQTLLFSATMSKEIRELVRSVQHEAETVEVGERRTPIETVTQHFYAVQQDSKMDLLLHILNTKQLDSVLVFSRTKHNADRITKRLEKGGFRAVAIHSNRTQAQRQNALAGFKQGDYQIMVATDIAARGIDVDGISHVINFDTPVFAEDYIHRIGRTGRATAAGDALTFVSHGENDALRRIERFVGTKHDVRAYPDFTAPKKEHGHHSVKVAPARHGKPQARTRHSGAGTSTSRGRSGQSRRNGSNGQTTSRPGARKQGQKTRRPEQSSSPGNDWRSLIEKAEQPTIRKRIVKFFKS